MSDETIYERGDTRIDVGTLTGDLRVFDKGDLIEIAEDGGCIEGAIRYLRAEVERLEKLHELDGKDMDAVIHFLRDNGFVYSPSAPGIKYRLNGTLITDEKIDAAWHALLNRVICLGWHDDWVEYAVAILRLVGIVACPECGGSGRRIDLPDRACKGCHGHGWIIKEHGDE